MKLKLFNATVFVQNLPVAHWATNGDTQKIVYAACYSWEHFAKILGVPVGRLRKHGSACAGAPATAYCLSRPGRGHYKPEHTATGYLDCWFDLPPLYPVVEQAKQDYLLTISRHVAADRKSTRLNSSHVSESRMPSSA